MNYDRISIDPDVVAGKPRIKGTRIAVSLLLEKLGSGETIDDLLGAHPHIAREDILAALAYAADFIRATHIYGRLEDN